MTIPAEASIPDEVYILEETEGKIEVLRGDDDTIYIHCGKILSYAEARQLHHGLLAILSGRFSRAVSVSEYEFDLAKRASVRPSLDRAPRPVAPSPSLESL